MSLRAQLLQTIRDAARNLHVDPRITFTGPLDTKVPDEVRDDVLATLREALSNAARHAEAGQVHVEVTVTEPEPGRGLAAGAERARRRAAASGRDPDRAGGWPTWVTGPHAGVAGAWWSRMRTVARTSTGACRCPPSPVRSPTIRWR